MNEDKMCNSITLMPNKYTTTKYNMIVQHNIIIVKIIIKE